MKQSRRKSRNYYALYSATTEPVLPEITARIARKDLPHQSWVQQVTGAFFAAIIYFIRQVLALALAVFLLLLLARFAFTFFHLSLGLLTFWVSRLTTPPLTPFVQLLYPVPALLPYSYYTIDISVLVAMVAYTLIVALIRWILKPARTR